MLQSGDGNYGFVSQSNASTSKATVNQGDAFGSSNGSFASVSLHDGAFLTTLTQRGSANIAYSDQSGYFNEEKLLQSGYGNYANVSRNGATLADRNIANVTQTGNGFSVNVSQSGNRNVANISQH